MGKPVAGVDGAWSCPGCQNVNFAKREQCNRCALPKPPEAFEAYEVAETGLESTLSPTETKRAPPVAGLDGNWACEACGNVNFHFRETCNRCATPKPQFRVASGKGRPVAGINGNWACLACGNVNFPSRDACNLCATPKEPEQKPQKRGPPMAGMDGNWACGACGNVNFAHRDLCNLCSAPNAPMAAPQTLERLETPKGQNKGPVAGVDGNWTCLACSNVNFAKREMCNRCTALKPVDSVPFAPPGERAVFGGTIPAFHTSYTTSSLVTHRGPPVAGVDGNWSCPGCQNVNFAHRSSCNRCGLSKPEERRGSRPVAGVNGNWACVACDNVNFPTRTHCNLCSAAKPNESNESNEMDGESVGKGRGKGAAPVVGVDGNWLCVQCQNANYGIRLSCNRCGAQKPAKRKAPTAGEKGNWQCLECNNVNFAHRTECNRCGVAKPEGLEAVDEGTWQDAKRSRTS